jgi:glycosyltransferase involved in cell wall biosynthesis
MRILIVLTYYRPHISGLTIYVERLARALAQHGHQVTVLTSRFDSSLPAQEIVEGVKVIRHPVAFKLSKGAIMPGFLTHALKLMTEHDVVSVHLPQAEAGPLAFLGRVIARKPVVLTYHCDLQLPPGLFNRLVDRLVFASNWVAGLFARRIVAYTRDYAINSPFLSRFMDKIAVIYPPVEMPAPDPDAVAALKNKFHVQGHCAVGFAARFAEEKGIDYLIGALPLVAEKCPSVKFLLAGETLKVIGENVWDRLQPQIEQNRQHLAILGAIPNREMGNFFGACDVLTVPSINSTESFGLVQVEAMLSGCPVVASNLPGVREPVRVTGMGEIVPIRDARALADAIIRVISNKSNYVRPRSEIEAIFSLATTLAAYEKLFGELTQQNG